MFDNLTSRLQNSFKKLTGKNSISESNISEVLQDIRKALIEADVALPVIKSFINDVKEKAIGTEINPRLNPEQAFIEIINQELTKAMGEKNEELNLRCQPPAVILMAGLQGAGKTTSVAKLAKFLKEKKKKVLVVSADVYRPAAIQQLETLAESIEVDFFPSTTEQSPVEIAKLALDKAKKGFYDVLIVDTAGRLHVDSDMMAEIKDLHSVLNPVETLFTVDAMTGQDAANTAKAFNEALTLTGVILTKLDGDVRGGAALSIRQITGKPIKFIGVGEKTDALEPFHPDRIAQRILDMGDILTLIEKIKTTLADEAKKGPSSKKLRKKKPGELFDLNDFLEQQRNMSKMGNMQGIMSMMPGANQLKDKIDFDKVEKKMKVTQSIIESMTPAERTNPKIIKFSRKQRIAAGCGRTLEDINTVLNDFEKMQKLQKMMQSGGLNHLMKGLGGMGNGLGELGRLAGKMFGNRK